MVQITTIRVVRKRSVQPEQFGSAMAEVEFTGNVTEGEDPKAVARQMLVDTRALVYENLGMKLPADIVASYAEVDTPQETAEAEIMAAKPKGRGRPAGSKNTAPKKETKAAERKRLKAEAEAAAAAGSDDIPGDDIPGDEPTPNISTGGDRVSPEDDVPGDDTAPDAEEGGDDELTAETLHKFLIDNIAAHTLTTIQVKQMQREMKVARVRDLDTPEKLAKAMAMVNSSIALNAAEANS